MLLPTLVGLVVLESKRHRFASIVARDDWTLGVFCAYLYYNFILIILQEELDVCTPHEAP